MKEPYRKGIANRLALSLAEAVARLPSKGRYPPLRERPSKHRELAQKFDELEQKYERHDAHIQEIFEAIRQLIEQPVTARRQIGFKPGTQEPPAK